MVVDFESENQRLRRLLQDAEEDLERERRRHRETKDWYESELARLKQRDPKGKGRAS